MKRVLITGMSGTGKSSVIAELAARGYNAVDADEGGLSELVSVPLDELTGLGPGQDWVWREDRIKELLSSGDTDPLFLSGCSPNQGKFYPQFDHIFLLTAPPAIIVERLATRTTNPYGKRLEEVARVGPLVGVDQRAALKLDPDRCLGNGVNGRCRRHQRPAGEGDRQVSDGGDAGEVGAVGAVVVQSVLG